MTDELVFMLISWDSSDTWRIHGIFTDIYMRENSKEIKVKQNILKNMHDSTKMYLIPLNHYINKGMII